MASSRPSRIRSTLLRGMVTEDSSTEVIIGRTGHPAGGGWTVLKVSIELLLNFKDGILNYSLRKINSSISSFKMKEWRVCNFEYNIPKIVVLILSVLYIKTFKLTVFGVCYNFHKIDVLVYQ